MTYRPIEELESGLAEVRLSPADAGRVMLIARRPFAGSRELLDEAVLDVDRGLVGDGWANLGSRRTPDGSADREAQITMMNSRLAELLAGAPNGWEIAGDQLYVDLDLSMANLPPGTGLRIGGALLEVSVIPHTGCAQFSSRFGMDALRFVSTPSGRDLRLRGVNTRIVEGGTIRIGDTIRKA